MTQQGGPAGEQAAVGLEGAQAGRRIAHIPHSQPWLGALPALSQPGPQAPTAPSRAAPELDKPWPPSCACNQTKRLAWGYPRSQAVPPLPDGDSPALAEKSPIVVQGPACSHQGPLS